MNILIVFNNYYYRGGEETYVNNLKRLLIEKGNKVRIYSKDSRSIVSFIDKIKAGIGLFWNPTVYRELETVIKEFRPTVAHFHNIYPLIGPTAYYTCRKYNVKIVQTIHNYKFICPKNSLFRNGKICERCTQNNLFLPSVIFRCYHNSRLASFIYSLSYFLHKAIGTFNFIRVFIFPSRFTLQYFLTRIRLDKKKCVYLPYHIFKPKERNNHKTRNHFLYVGRLSEEKGILSLAMAAKDNQQLILHIIGHGPLEKEIKKLSRYYKNIVFLGGRKNTSIYKSMLISKGVIVPSLWYEVLPNTVLEAIGSGVNVFVPRQNRNLSKLSLKSKKIHSYLNFLHLFRMLRKIGTFEKNTLRETDVLLNEIHPAFHYEKLISIYQK